MDRPRLSDRALVRRHSVDGAVHVAVHDAETGRLHLLTPMQWRIARLADGTRGVDEIAALAADGARETSVGEVTELFDALARVDLLEEGSRGEERAAGEALVAKRRLALLGERAIDPLPDFALACDGRGECCSSYGSILLTASDLARARETGLRAFPGMTGDEGSYTPFRGAASTDGFAMAMVDGRCVALADDGRCGLHARGGEAAKPVGCRTYPVTFLDDGEVVRASVACECSCVFRSLARGSDGEAGLVHGARTTKDLDEETTVRTIPDVVPITATSVAPRDVVARWSRAAALIDPAAHPIGALLDRAAALRASAFAAGAHASDGPIDATSWLAAEVEAFAGEAERSARAADEWRSARDRTRIARGIVAGAARRAAAADRVRALFAAEGDRRAEAFFVRAGIFGLLFGLPLADGLVRAAARLVVAREIAATVEPGEGHPIAIVEMTYRGFTV